MTDKAYDVIVEIEYTVKRRLLLCGVPTKDATRLSAILAEYADGADPGVLPPWQQSEPRVAVVESRDENSEVPFENNPNE